MITVNSLHAPNRFHTFWFRNKFKLLNKRNVVDFLLDRIDALENKSNKIMKTCNVKRILVLLITTIHNYI